MLIYQYQINEKLMRVKEYAAKLQQKFDNGNSPSDLLLDANSLESLFTDLVEILPERVADAGSFRRHMAWMEKRLREGKPDLCKQDIDEICEYDLPNLEKAFHHWCAKSIHLDEELKHGISNLLLHKELDSVNRKAFVVLTNRMRTLFHVDSSCDGEALVNKIFGKSGVLASCIPESDLQAMRNLLAGLYGVFRNKYSHGDQCSSWAETDAIVSMINQVLQDIQRLHRIYRAERSS